jgi:hypothetical protein
MEQEQILLLRIARTLFERTPHNSLTAGLLALWITGQDDLFPVVALSGRDWKDPRGLDEAVWRSLRKTVERQASANLPSAHVESGSVRFWQSEGFDEHELSILDFLLVVQVWPRVRVLFDALCAVKDTCFAEAIARCCGLDTTTVLEKLSPEGRLLTSGALIQTAGSASDRVAAQMTCAVASSGQGDRT